MDSDDYSTEDSNKRRREDAENEEKHFEKSRTFRISTKSHRHGEEQVNMKIILNVDIRNDGNQIRP